MQNIDIITVEEYFELLKKENLTPKDKLQKNEFEYFIKMCEENEDRLTQAAEEVYAKYKLYVTRLSITNQEERTGLENEKIANFQKSIEDREKKQNLEKEPVRKLSKAGYVDAVVVLAVLLNIGFIIAMAILGNK